MSDVLAALAAKNADARRLAALVSLAVQVEPELLRGLRLRLIPTADASAEADLWFSDLVDSKSPNAMVLRADLRATLQQELAASAADRDAAAAIIAEMHAGVSEVVRIQEQVDALALRGDPAALVQIEKVLQPIVRTLYDTDHAGLARWAARAFAQFQPAAQTTQTAWSMMRAAAGRLVGVGKTQPKVFVSSSSFMDLAKHREAVIQVLQGLGVMPLAIETDSPTAKSVITSTYAGVDAADMFVGIVGLRYGMVLDDPDSNPENRLVGELEYERAIERRIPVFMYLRSDDRTGEDYTDHTHIDEFRKKIVSRSAGGPTYFASIDDLKMHVTTDVGLLLPKPSSGWQAVESSIRALPRTPLYLTVARHSLAVGTEAVDGAARIDVPATEPLLIDVSWEGGSKGPKRVTRGSKRVALAKGQSIELSADPHGLTATTLLGESFDIRTAQKLDDWAIVLAIGKESVPDAERFEAWLVSPEGGGVPREQCIFNETSPDNPHETVSSSIKADMEIQYMDPRRRRLYYYIAGGPNAEAVLEGQGVREHLNRVARNFREVVVFADLAEGERIELEAGPGRRVVGIGQRFARVTEDRGSSSRLDSFTVQLIESLSGIVADEQGLITASALAEYTNYMASWSVSESFSNTFPIFQSDEFVTCIEIRNRRGSDPLGFRILDEHFKEVARLPHEAPVRRRLLRGRYILDVPALSLVQRFDTSDDAPLVHVDIEAPRENAPYIIVAGSGSSLRSEEAWLAEAMGHRLAGSGFRLVTRAWQGVEEVCLKAFAEKLSQLGIPFYNRIFEFMRSDYPHGEWEGSSNPAFTETAGYDRPLRKAAAFVAIGGNGGTERYAWRARELEVPVIPVASTGGGAGLLYRQYSGPEWLENPIENKADADAIAVRIVAWLLDHLPSIRR